MRIKIKKRNHHNNRLWFDLTSSSNTSVKLLKKFSALLWMCAESNVTWNHSDCTSLHCSQGGSWWLALRLDELNGANIRQWKNINAQHYFNYVLDTPYLVQCTNYCSKTSTFTLLGGKMNYLKERLLHLASKIDVEEQYNKDKRNWVHIAGMQTIAKPNVSTKGDSWG